MRKWIITALSVLAVFVIAVSMAQADDDKGTVQITGKNVNLVKTLCGADAPAADGNALVVTEIVDADGKAIEDLKGKIVHYLPVEAAAPLRAGEANLDKVVVVKGVLYKNAQTIAVQEFEVKAEQAADGDSDSFDEWDELGVTTMSQQQVI
jgi:hypothetical protein